MTHKELCEKYQSLRPRWKLVRSMVKDIEHFRIPITDHEEAQYGDNRLNYTHVACVVGEDGHAYVGVARLNTDTTKDGRDKGGPYNRKVGLQVAFGRALMALWTGNDPAAQRMESRNPTWRERFFAARGRNWDDFKVGRLLVGRELRDKCREGLFEIEILRQTEMDAWREQMEELERSSRKGSRGKKRNGESADTPPELITTVTSEEFPSESKPTPMTAKARSLPSTSSSKRGKRETRD